MSTAKVSEVGNAAPPDQTPVDAPSTPMDLAAASDPQGPLPSGDGDIAALRARLSREVRKLELVQEIGRALGSTLDIDRLLRLIMERVSKAVDAERSTLYLLSEDGSELWSRVAQGDQGDQGEAMREIRLKVGEGIAGWVAESGQTASLPDAYGDPRFQSEIDRRTGFRTRSMMVVPMRNNQGRVIGVIQVLNKCAAAAFTADDEALLHAIAAQAAISIENSKLYASVVGKNEQLLVTQDKLEHKTYELNLLFEIEEEVNGAFSLDELLDRLLRRAMDLISAQAGSILLREGDSDDLYFRSAQGGAGEVVKRLKIPMGDGIAGWVALHREPQIVNDPAKDTRHNQGIASRVGYAVRNILCAPLSAGEESLGAIELLNKAGSPAEFTPEDEKLLSLIAGQASKAIQLARAKEEKLNQSRLASIGQMLSSILHDLKTPMTIVSGYAQLMAQQDDVQHRQQFSEQILRQLEHMNVMTREVLAFARGESNVLIRKVYLHRFIEEIADHLKHEFAGRNIALVIKPDYNGVAFFDESKFLRVVHNLARNAFQAMVSGGTFTVQVAAEAKELVWTFGDTGAGIPPEMEGRLFEAFATSGKQDGTGLGLAIVKKIVDEHLGTISYSSTRGAGTSFEIRLPLERTLTGDEQSTGRGLTSGRPN
jgi:signal transduction histidine kinase